jgi:hypothetical protein
MSDLEIKKSPRTKDLWSINEGLLYAFAEVEHTDKLVHNIVLNSNGKKVQLTNFDIRVLLNILKEGNYMLLEETAFPIK